MNGPRYAYENPADLAWGARMLRTGRERRRLRLAREAAERAEVAKAQPGKGSRPADAVGVVKGGDRDG